MLHQPPFKWTDQTHAVAMQMWADGQTMAKIAAFVGTYKNSVASYMNRKRFDFPFRNGPSFGKVTWTEELISKAEVHWRHGLTAKVIAAEIGCSVGAMLSLTDRFRDRFPKRGYQKAASTITVGKQVQNQTAISSNQRRKAAKENHDRINAGLPPITHHKIVTDFSKFAIDGVKPVTFLLVSDRQCKFPVDNTEGADMACCGGDATHGSYCSHHASISRGQGNRAEQHAIDGMGGRRA